jgi:Transglutaminase-like superfamily
MGSIRRHLFTLLFVLILVVGLAWIKETNKAREFFTLNPSLSLLDGRVTLRSHWMGNYLNGRKSGYTEVHIKEDPKSGSGQFIVQMRSDIVLDIFGKKIKMTQENSATVNKDLTLCALETRSYADSVPAKMWVTVQDGVLDVTRTGAGETSHQSLEIKGPIYNAEVLGMLALKRGFVKDDKFKVSIFEPTLGAIQEVAIHVIGPRTIKRASEEFACTLVEVEIFGMKQSSWLSEDGISYVDESSVAGFNMVGVMESQADANNTNSNTVDQWQYGTSGKTKAPPGEFDIFVKSLITPNVRFTDSAKVLHATYTLGKVAKDSVASDGRQRILAWDEDSEKLRVAINSPGYYELRERTKKDYRLGDDLQKLFPLETASTLYIQRDHKLIKDKAASIIGKEKDPFLASVALYEWLADRMNITKEIRATIPDALEVLKSGSGDCNEHAVLYAALARSVGIPCKVCVGLVYAPSLESFGYHAWNEVLISEEPPTWYALDCALGQKRVDATHIKVAEGDMTKWLAIVPLVGKMTLTVESYND